MGSAHATGGAASTSESSSSGIRVTILTSLDGQKTGVEEGDSPLSPKGDVFPVEPRARVPPCCSARALVRTVPDSGRPRSSRSHVDQPVYPRSGAPRRRKVLVRVGQALGGASVLRRGR